MVRLSQMGPLQSFSRSPKNEHPYFQIKLFPYNVIRRKSLMKKYRCIICGYVYDPEVGDPDSGIAPGTAFEDIPEDWVCPLCGVDKSNFEPVD